MNNKLPAIFVAFLVLLAPFGVLAETFPDTPPPQHYYVDEAGMIDEKLGARIDHLAATLLAQKKTPLYVVTISSLGSHAAGNMGIERYATALFNHWGIGRQDHNNGMLLLISKGDRRARIELGADWGSGNNPMAQRVMNRLIVPAFVRGDYATGIGDGVHGLDAMARGLNLPMATPPHWLVLAVLGGVVLLVVMIVNLFRSGRSGWAWALMGVLGVILFFIIKAMLSAPRHRSSSFFDFGSSDSSLFDFGSDSGFGGGFSDGGGATGSW